MKTLNLNQLEAVNGGDVVDIVDGACATVGVAALFGVVTTPVAIGCALWGVGRWLS